MDHPILSVEDVAVTEGDSGTTEALFTVNLLVPNEKTVTVDYFTEDGTAAVDIDYVAGAGRITFPPGDTEETISVEVNGDLWDELDETFIVRLAHPVNATLGDEQGVGTILNDDYDIPPELIGDLRATTPAEFVYTLLPAVAMSASGEGGSNTMDKAVDGDPSTLWSTPGRTAVQVEQITLDLGAVLEVGRFRLLSRESSGAFFPEDFTFELSTDHQIFTPARAVSDFAAAAGTWYSFDFAPSVARYVRIRVTQSRRHPAGLYFVQLAEVEVYQATMPADVATLHWTAPSDNGMSGSASSYDIRYSFSSIDRDSDFETATQLTGEPAPRSAGSAESFTVTGLPGEAILYFAIKSADDVPNVSALSNTAMYTTGIAPAAVGNLEARAESASSIELSWTATGDDRMVGVADSYDIRSSLSPIGNDADFESATELSGEADPEVSGTPQSMTVDHLDSDTTYFFAMKVLDEVGNASLLSNVASARTEDDVPPAAIGDLAVLAPQGLVYTPLPAAAVSASGEVGIQHDGQGGRRDHHDTLEHAGPLFDGDRADHAGPRRCFRCGPPASSLPSRQRGVFPRDFTVELSVDNQDFTPAHSVTDFSAVAGTWYPFDFTPGSARYVRIRVTESGRSSGGLYFVQIAEVELYQATVPIDGATLAWTAPGDSGSEGTVSSYDIRYSLSPIDEDIDFVAATELDGEPVPRSAGSTESFTVTGLPVEATLYFAIKSADEVPNVSALSNTVTYTTPIVAPAAVNDLEASAESATSIELSWTATGDNGMVGVAHSYDIRFNLSPIGTNADFDIATELTGEPSPGVSGTLQSMTVDHLDSDTNYYFAMKVFDEMGNVSMLSNVVSARTEDGVPPAAIGDLTASPPEGLAYSVSPAVAMSASGEVGSNTMDKAVDGDSHTLWSTPGRSSMQVEQITLDLGAVFEAGRLRLLSRASSGDFFPKDFTVELSLDNQSFYTGSSRSPTSSPRPGLGTPSTLLQARLATFGYGLPSRAVTRRVCTSCRLPKSSCTRPPCRSTEPPSHGRPPATAVSNGTASSYDIRYGFSPIDEDIDFDAATELDGEPAPQPAGSLESFTVSGLPVEATLYFAIKSADEVPNVSALSNNAMILHAECCACRPSMISRRARKAHTSIELSWTATGDDGMVGIADSYDIRFSLSPINNDTDFDGATELVRGARSWSLRHASVHDCRRLSTPKRPTSLP